MEKIINLTQHLPTEEQITNGVIHLDDRYEEIKILLTFEDLPKKEEIEDRAIRLANIAYEEGFKKALIGGAPYFMAELEKELLNKGIIPVYSFSKRIVEEKVNENGEVVKKTIFKHIGFIEKYNLDRIENV